MQSIVFNSYAKLNLFLHIKGKRADGYHELESAFCGISFGDTIELEKAEHTALICTDASLDDERNLAHRAAEAFFDYTGLPGGVNIYMTKRIPIRSGLGGGSSNAGCVLLALNELYCTKLKKHELAAIGERLGADVPFFVYGRPALATGAGEQLFPLMNNLAAFYLVIKPEGGVDTRECFALYDTLPEQETDTAAAVSAIETGDINTFARKAKNVLAEAATLLCPDIARAISFAYENGAMYAQMTGSGSSVYALFLDRAIAVSVLTEAKKQFPFACVISARDTTYEPVRYK